MVCEKSIDYIVQIFLFLVTEETTVMRSHTLQTKRQTRNTTNKDKDKQEN